MKERSKAMSSMQCASRSIQAISEETHLLIVAAIWRKRTTKHQQLVGYVLGLAGHGPDRFFHFGGRGVAIERREHINKMPGIIL